MYDVHGAFCAEMERYGDCVCADTSKLDAVKAAYVERTQGYTLLKAGEKYAQRTVHAFSTR